MSSVQLGWLCMPDVWLHLPIQLRVAGRGVEVYAGVVIHIADSGKQDGTGAVLSRAVGRPRTHRSSPACRAWSPVDI